MRDDPEHERTRRTAKEEARRAAAEARAKAAEALTGDMKEEVIRQLGLIYGGLILIGVYMVQPFLVAPSLDVPAKVSVLAFAVAIPLLAALVMLNRQEAFRRRRTTSVTVNVAHSIAQAASFVGIVAGFWHITWGAIRRDQPPRVPRGVSPGHRVRALPGPTKTRRQECRGRGSSRPTASV